MRLVVGWLLVCAALSGGARAHSLGIDRARLIERADANYTLVATVPPSLAHLITAPDLPAHCAPSGPPGGRRGADQVRFDFACEVPLTARDALRLPWRREGVMLTVDWADGVTATHMLRREGDAIPVNLATFQASSGSVADAARRYTALGIEHILLGVDHLLFVFGLLLLVRGRWMLLKTITGFTLAHSITLALATLGFVDAPSRPVEAAIALSIVFVAVEVLHLRQGRIGLSARRPWLVATGFGLLHGFGFAGALSEIGLPPGEIPLALLFFNVGVEVGQLMFVGGVLAVGWALRRLSVSWPTWWPRWVELLPAYTIGTLAMFWFIDRAAWLVPIGPPS